MTKVVPVTKQGEEGLFKGSLQAPFHMPLLLWQIQKTSLPIGKDCFAIERQ